MSDKTNAKKVVYPVVLCGGAGSRLWPMSRPEKPKQFHQLVNENSLLANTVARMPNGIVGAFDFRPAIILGNESLLEEFRAEINAGGLKSETIVLEPLIRDTAPAIAAVTAFLQQNDPQAYALVVPSDARIDDIAAFEKAATAALDVAVSDDRIMTIGIKPTRPDTQYGYIEKGAPVGLGHIVTRFKEKPDEQTAQSYLDSGNFVWNAGMFLFSSEHMAAQFDALQPQMWKYASHAVRRATREGVFVRLEQNAFAACDRLSMDYAIMEKAGRVGVVEAQFDWDDLGSWAQLYERAHKDENANAINGHGFVVDATGNFIRARDAVVGVAGISGITVVAEDGKVLVVPTDKAHLVKDVTAGYKALQAKSPGLSDGDTVVIRRWLFEQALPFWLNHGLDHIHGGVHEALNFDGSPAPHPTKRLRVLGRQIYSFAHAHKMGFKGDAAGAVRHCFKTLVQTGWHRDGGWIHLYDQKGRVINSARDTYDQCFSLLGFAWMIRAGIDVEAAREQADRTISFMQNQLADPVHGGFIEGIDVPDTGMRRANPHMHFLEASLALYEATGEDQHLNWATQMVDLFEDHFYDGQTATLREFFNDNWSVHKADASARVEPGHHYEWAWLLLRYLEHRERAGLEAKARSLFSIARAMGHHNRTKAVADSIMPDGSDVSVTARCWPQTEALKAAIAFEKRGMTAATGMKKDMLKTLFEHYLNGPAQGGWFDRIDQTGRVCAPDMPSSTLYHVHCAIAEFLGD